MNDFRSNLNQVVKDIFNFSDSFLEVLKQVKSSPKLSIKLFMSPIMILTLKDRYPKTIISKAFLTCTHRNPITYFFYPEIRDNPISCTCQRLLKIKESKRIYNFYFWTLQKICSQKGWSLCIKCKKVHCKYNKGFFFSLFSLNWFGYCIPSIEFHHLILIGYLYAFLLVDGAHYTAVSASQISTHVRILSFPFERGHSLIE